jgi:hypothetical protein
MMATAGFDVLKAIALTFCKSGDIVSCHFGTGTAAMDTLNLVQLKLLVAHERARYDLALRQLGGPVALDCPYLYNPRSNKFPLNFAVLAGSPKV